MQTFVTLLPCYKTAMSVLYVNEFACLLIVSIPVLFFFFKNIYPHILEFKNAPVF